MQTARRSHRFPSLLLAAVLSGPAVWWVSAGGVAAQSLPRESVETFPFVGEVKGKDVSVRAGPSVHFRRLGKLSAPTKVTVLGRSYGWYKIRLPEEAEAYVALEFLEDTGGDKARVKVDTLNVRGGPGTTYGLLGQLKKGEEVTLLERRPDGWARIAPSAHLYAWMAAEYVTWIQAGQPSEETHSTLARKTAVEEQSPTQSLSRQEVSADEAIAERSGVGRLVVVKHTNGDRAEARLETRDGQDWILEIPAFAAEVFDQTVVRVKAVPCPEGSVNSFDHMTPPQDRFCATRIEWLL